MKNKPIILLLIAVLAMARLAGAQTHGNFSDWNVPVPQLPGTTAKGAVNNKAGVVPQFTTDVPPVSLPQTGPVQLSKLQPVLLVSPAVAAPRQPVIPGEAAGNFGMPLPDAPDAPSLPKQVPQDAPVKLSADIEAPAAPPMPDFPKGVPAETATSSARRPVRIPVTPALITQTSPELSPGGQFPFSELAIPALPEDADIRLILPEIAPPVKASPKPKQAGKKARRNSN